MDSSADCFDQTSVKHEAAVPHHPALGKVVPHARYEQVFSQLLLVDAFPDKIPQNCPHSQQCAAYSSSGCFAPYTSSGYFATNSWPLIG